MLHLRLDDERLLVARRRGSGGRCGSRGGGSAAIAEHRVVGIELAAEADRLLPRFALTVRHRVQLGGDRLERRRLVVLRVDLEQLEIDFLALRILLERVLQDFLGLRIAAVGEVDLGFRDRIDFVGVDVAESFAAEFARERVVAGVDDAAAGRAEHGVGLDVGARDDAVLELGRLAPAHRDDAGDAGQHRERARADDPCRRIADEVLEESGRLLRGRLRRHLGRRRLRRFGLRRLGGFGDSVVVVAAGGEVAGGSAFGVSGGVVAAAGGGVVDGSLRRFVRRCRRRVVADGVVADGVVADGVVAGGVWRTASPRRAPSRPLPVAASPSRPRLAPAAALPCRSSARSSSADRRASSRATRCAPALPAAPCRGRRLPRPRRRRPCPVRLRGTP